MPNELKSELHKAFGQARGILQDLQRLGLGDVYCSPAKKLDEFSGRVSSPHSIDERLSEIESDLKDCQRCSLAAGRTKVVFGVGNPNAEIVFVGEGPGEKEDRVGAPFADEAGELLDKILLAMGLSRDDVYLCTLVKCLSPCNRKPDTIEVAACEPFLVRQINSIRPEIIVTLGSFATQALLKSDLSISRLRGEWQQYLAIPLMPTFDPAHLMDNPLGKREVWDDMKAVLRRLSGRHKDLC